MSQILPACTLEETNFLVFFHSIAHPYSSLRSLLPPLEILIYLLVFEPPPNSPAYPHEQKYQSFVSYALSHLSNRFYVHLFTRLYTPSSIITHSTKPSSDKLYVCVEVSTKTNSVRLNFYHWCKTPSSAFSKKNSVTTPNFCRFNGTR